LEDKLSKKKPETKAELIAEALSIEVPCCGKDECLDCPYDAPAFEPTPEAIEEPVEAPLETSKDAWLYIVKDGDSWASIAAEFAPSGVKKHAYATQLIAVNGSALRSGMEIKL
jgi:hypothetical protein